MHRAKLERLEGAATVNKLSPLDVFCIHAAEFGVGPHAMQYGGVPIQFFSDLVLGRWWHDAGTCGCMLKPFYCPIDKSPPLSDYVREVAGCIV